MKILVTHINPHLDDIAAIWLFRKFVPEFKDAELEFVSSNKVETGVEDSEDKVYLGVGRGQFDEHKGDVNDCATSLVAKFLKEEGLYFKDPIESSALDELVEYVRLDDTGKLPVGEYAEFSVPAFIRPMDNSSGSSEKAVILGEQILERILKILIQKHKALKDWEKRVEVKTPLGKLIAIESENVSRAFCKKTGGADLFLMVDPVEKSVQYYSDELDLEPIYKKVKALDKEADWFLHQSHHMVICGGGAAPESKKTKLSFEELINVVKFT